MLRGQLREHTFLQNDIKSRHLLPSVSGQDCTLSGNSYFHIEPHGPKTVPKSFLNGCMPLRHPSDQAKQGIHWGFSPKFQTGLSHVVGWTKRRLKCLLLPKAHTQVTLVRKDQSRTHKPLTRIRGTNEAK